MTFIDMAELGRLAAQGPSAGEEPVQTTGRPVGGKADPLLATEGDFCDRLGDLAGAIVSAKAREKGQGAGKASGAGALVDYAVDNICAWVTADDGPFGIKRAPEGDSEYHEPDPDPKPVSGPGSPAGGTTGPGELSASTPLTGLGQPAGGTPQPPPEGTTPPQDGGTTTPPQDDADDGDEPGDDATDEPAGFVPSEETSGLTPGDITRAKRIIGSAPLDFGRDRESGLGAERPPAARPSVIDPPAEPPTNEETDLWKIINRIPADPPQPGIETTLVTVGILARGAGTAAFVGRAQNRATYILSGLPIISASGHIESVGLLSGHRDVALALAAGPTRDTKIAGLFQSAQRGLRRLRGAGERILPNRLRLHPRRREEDSQP